MNENEFVYRCIDGESDYFIDLSKKIWKFAELGFEEFHSSETLIQALVQEGFSVTRHIANIPTAFKGSWGHGRPVIGILGEFDALPGLSQEAGIPLKKPLKEGAPGHGCGHNLLGVGALAGAFALKRYLEKTKADGTIVFYGTPAEENLSGKTFMARDGAFDGVDLFLTWHPSRFNRVGSFHQDANISRIYRFKGTTAHAAASPELGRSALDSCELMDVGVNYLREHIMMEARIHYAYIDTGGTAPNVVPDHAALRYMVRAPYLYQVKSIFKRVDDIARGAALMCGTSVSMQTEAGCSEYIPNDVLARVADRMLHEVGAPAWSDEDYELARKFTENYSEEWKQAEKEAIIHRYGEDQLSKKLEHPLDTKIENYNGEARIAKFASTDVGDVGHIAPTVYFNVASEVIGTQGHTWQIASQVASSIGMKGMLVAAKVIALTGIYLHQHPETIKEAQEEFLRIHKKGYDCPVQGVSELPSYNVK